jgi:CBS domain-containing protein
MKVKDVLREKGYEVFSIEENYSIFDAITKLVEKNIGALIVKNRDGKVVGIISERDIMRESYKNLDRLREVPVHKVMTRKLIVGNLEDELEQVERVMTQNRIRHYPIFENDELIGIISIGDVVKHRLIECSLENRHLKDYITGKYPA